MLENDVPDADVEMLVYYDLPSCCRCSEGPLEDRVFEIYSSNTPAQYINAREMYIPTIKIITIIINIILYALYLTHGACTSCLQKYIFLIQIPPPPNYLEQNVPVIALIC